MLKNLRYLTLWQRRLIFFLVAGGFLMALLAVTWLLARQALTSGARVVAVPLVADVAVREFAALPDDDAYPASVTSAPDGTIYTGSYKSGAVWSITPDGVVTEIEGTREGIGAVSGIAIATDGSLLIVDQVDADPRTAGGNIKRVESGTVSTFAAIDDAQGFISPNDIVVDSAGSVYVSDPGRNEIWRFNAAGGEGTIWWVAPESVPSEDSTPPAETESSRRRGLTGLAYDPIRAAIIVTDPELNEIFSIAISDGSWNLVYQHGNRERPPGFDGAAVTSDGTLYVAALGTNGIAKVQDNTLEYIAAGFRGASDVEAVGDNSLVVANFDQASLAPLVLPLFAPQLPFALDVIEFGPSSN